MPRERRFHTRSPGGRVHAPNTASKLWFSPTTTIRCSIGVVAAGCGAETAAALTPCCARGTLATQTTAQTATAARAGNLLIRHHASSRRYYPYRISILRDKGVATCDPRVASVE